MNDLEMKIEIEIGKKKVPINFSDFFDVDEENLTKEFARQASLFAYLSALQADAERELAEAASKRDVEYAQADEGYRQELDEEGRKYTEAVIKSMIMQDEDYAKVDKSYRKASHTANMLKLLVRAMAQRSDMLVSLGAHLRQEWEMTGMHMREKAYNEAVVTARDAILKKRNNT